MTITDPVRLLLGISTPSTATTRSRSPSPSTSIGVTCAGAWIGARTVSVNEPRGDCRIQLTRSRSASHTTTSGRPSLSRSAICTYVTRGRSPAAGRSPIGDAWKNPEGGPSGSIDVETPGFPSAARPQPEINVAQISRANPDVRWTRFPEGLMIISRRRNYRPEWRGAISGGELVETRVDRKADVCRDTIGCVRAVDDAEGRSLAVEIHERLGRPRVRAKTIERDGVPV